jgi:hypothetical protein
MDDKKTLVSSRLLYKSTLGFICLSVRLPTKMMIGDWCEKFPVEAHARFLTPINSRVAAADCKYLASPHDGYQIDDLMRKICLRGRFFSMPRSLEFLPRNPSLAACISAW